MPRIDISVEAKDNASATLDSVRNKLQLFDQFGRSVSDLSEEFDRVDRSIGGFDISVSKATRAAKGLAVPLISELSPALGSTAASMGQVVTSALILGSGLGALTIAAAGVVGVLVGSFITSWREAAQKVEAFDKAQKSVDFATVTASLATQRAELTTLTNDVDKYWKALNELRGTQEALRGTEFYAGDDAGNQIRALEAKLEAARQMVAAATQRQQLFVRGREHSDWVRAEYDDGGEAQRTDTETGGMKLRLADIRRQVVEVGILDPIARAYAAAVRDAETARQQAGGGATQAEIADERLALAKATRDEALRLRSIKLRLGGDAGYDEGLAFAITPEDIAQGTFAAQRKAFEGQEPAGTPGLDDVAEFEGLSPQTGVDTSRARKIVTDADLRDSERLLQIDRDRLLLATQRTDLSVAERAALDAEAIQADYLLKIEQARGDAAKEFSAEVEKQVRLQQLLERTDAVAGLKRGISDVEQEFGNAGTRMQEVAHTVGAEFGRAFSDSVLRPVEEGLKGLPPLLRAVLMSMTRALSDDLGKAITAQLFGGLRALVAPGGLR